MLPVFDKNLPKKMNAETLTETTRKKAEALVRIEEQRTNSKMLAYERVARLLNVSGSWLRKFIGRQVGVLDVPKYVSIDNAFSKLADRMEREAEIEKQKIKLLNRQYRAEFERDLPLFSILDESPSFEVGADSSNIFCLAEESP